MLRKLSFVLGIIWFSIGSLYADDALLEQFYGNGVHAFNQGDYLGAHAALTAAIKGGTNDPRTYYFRGLTYLQLGRVPEAQADFQAGAELEVGDSADVYPVNRSLERIQGRSRQILEQYRMVVHAAAIQKKEAERRARYEERAAAEHDVLRRVAPTELPSASQAPSNGNPTSPEASPAAAAEENPFTKPAESDAPPSNKAKDDSAPDKAMAPAEDKNPFDAEPTKPEPSKSTPIPPPTSDDPFSEPPKPAPPAKTGGTAPTSANHNDSAVKPAAGGVGSLFRAVAKGLQTDQTAAPGAPLSAPMPDILRGILGKNQAGASGSPDANPAPHPGDQGPPAGGPPPTMTSHPEPAPMKPAAGGEMPAAQPATPAGAPQPTNPAEPPKDNDNPFN